MHWRRLGALVGVVALLAVVPGQGAFGASGGPAGPNLTWRGNGTRGVTTFNGSPSGVGLYLPGSDQTTSFNLPLVRTDGQYDTIVHVANATASSNQATITFYDANGGAPVATSTQTLAGWASWTDDVQVDSSAPAVNANFQGSAQVTATGPIAVSVDVLNNPSIPTDNLDSYQEVPGNTTVPGDSTNTAYVPLIPSLTGTVTPNLYLQNTSSSSAAVNLSFYCTNPGNTPNYSCTAPPPPVTATATVPGHGDTALSVSQVMGISGLNFDAATKIQSDQPLAVAVDDIAPSEFWATAPTSAEVSTTFSMPRFEYNGSTHGGGWNTGLVLLNTSSQPENFTVSIYDPNGNLVPYSPLSTPMDNIPPMGIAKFDYGGVNQNLGLPDGFVGSIVVTSTGSAVGWSGPYNQAFNAATSVILPTGPQTGSAVIVPGVRKNAAEIARSSSTASTGLAIQNPGATANTYQLGFYDASGNLVYTQNVYLAANAMWYVSQATDATLPNGFAGSARIVNLSGGALPIVSAEVDGGAFQPPPSLPLPTPPTPTATTPTVTPTATPIPPTPTAKSRVYLPAVFNGSQ